MPEITPIRKSLAFRQAPLADTNTQLKTLNHSSPAVEALPKFSSKLAETGLSPLKPLEIHTLQINLGKMCNQVCSHCHVDAGPDRTEIMTQATMTECLKAIAHPEITTVDLTGGAPEMNPNFRWFVEEITKLGKKTVVRCNLTIIMHAESYRDLPQFFARHGVEVVSSLPCYSKSNVDKQRGTGVFDKSIRALQLLNEVGYGKPGTGLTLNLVYNPGGASLAPNQEKLEVDYKRELKELFGIEFNQLFAITNLPVSRFLDFLVESGSLDDYLSRLVQAYNPAAAAGVMCRGLVSVSWDGRLYDCDFNQMLDIGVVCRHSASVADFSYDDLVRRTIAVNQHCYGCTAGQGSSCGGKTA